MRIDLAGNRYGRLTVLAVGPNRKRHTTWFCQCDCGNEVAVPTVTLRSGQCRSCGCLHRDITSAYAKKRYRSHLASSNIPDGWDELP